MVIQEKDAQTRNHHQCRETRNPCRRRRERQNRRHIRNSVGIKRTHFDNNRARHNKNPEKPEQATRNYIQKTDMMRLIAWTKDKNIKLVIDESFVDFAETSFLPVTYSKMIDFL